MSFVYSNSDIYSASVFVVICSVKCYFVLRYNGTWPKYKIHKPYPPKHEMKAKIRIFPNSIIYVYIHSSCVCIQQYLCFLLGETYAQYINISTLNATDGNDRCSILIPHMNHWIKHIPSCYTEFGTWFQKGVIKNAIRSFDRLYTNLHCYYGMDKLFHPRKTSH